MRTSAVRHYASGVPTSTLIELAAVAKVYRSGNLDTHTAAEMFELLRTLNDEGKTALYVTHDLSLAERAHRRVTIRDGLGSGG